MIGKSKRMMAALAAGGLLFGLAACSSSAEESDSAGDSYDILAVVSVSGAIADLGKASQNALKAAVDVINEDGGVLGREVRVEYVDDGGNPSEAVALVQAALASDSFDMVWPGTTSAHALAVLPITQAAGIITVGTGVSTALNDPSAYPLGFMTSAPAPASVASIIETLGEDGLSKVALIAPDSALGNDKIAAFEAQASKAGISVTAEKVDPKVVDPSAELARLQATNPEALVVMGALGPSGAALLNGIYKVGWDTPVYADDSTSDNNYAGIEAEVLENVFFQAARFAIAGEPVRDSEAYETYASALGAYEKDFVLAPDIYAYSYSGLVVTAAAVNKAGTTDPEAVKEAFESLEIEDAPFWFLSAEIGFTAENHFPAMTSDDMRVFPAQPVQSDGTFVAE